MSGGLSPVFSDVPCYNEASSGKLKREGDNQDVVMLFFVRDEEDL